MIGIVTIIIILVNGFNKKFKALRGLHNPTKTGAWIVHHGNSLPFLVFVTFLHVSTNAEDTQTGVVKGAVIIGLNCIWNSLMEYVLFDFFSMVIVVIFHLAIWLILVSPT